MFLAEPKMRPSRPCRPLAAAQFGMERYEEAAATFERAVKRNPDNELPRIYLASSYRLDGTTNVRFGS